MIKLSNNDIANAIYKASQNKTNQEMDNLVGNVVKFLNHKKILPKSKIVLEKLEKILNNKNGLLKVKIYSKEELGSSVKNDLSLFLIKKHKARQILFEEIYDKKLLGGFRLEVDDEVIDLTIFNKLKKLQAHLIR